MISEAINYVRPSSTIVSYVTGKIVSLPNIEIVSLPNIENEGEIVIIIITLATKNSPPLVPAGAPKALQLLTPKGTMRFILNSLTHTLPTQDNLKL